MAKSPEEEHPHKAFGWAAKDTSGILSPFHFSRRHEIVGLVTKTGSNVMKFKVDDRVGVGVMVNSCIMHMHRLGELCLNDIYIQCQTMMGRNLWWLFHTIVVDQHFVVRIPDSMPSDGGLGHVAVKIGKAFGLKVTVISSSSRKEREALDRLGADSFLVSNDPAKMKAAFGTMDYIIDTVSAVHALAPFLSLLKTNGKLVTLGLPEKPLELPIFPLVLGRKLVGGSDVGGMKETQEMLDFCAKHNIAADVEVIQMDQINTAMERLAKSDVRYRFVIDVANSLAQSQL
uniref:Uncharacterized protein n=1 Tax=Salix viminalis TaxID=40686 RepID=A0A6N2M8J7_SALVM